MCIRIRPELKHAESSLTQMNALTHAESSLTQMLLKAPPECLQGVHLLGWAPLGRLGQPGDLSAVDTDVTTEFLLLRNVLYSGLARKMPQAAMRIPDEAANSPILVVQVPVLRPRNDAAQPVLQADLVCFEAQLTATGSDETVELHRRPSFVQSLQALGERHSAYGTLHPQLSAGVPFVDVSAMNSLMYASKMQVRPLSEFSAC
jgi:hypothetical protein